MQADREPLLDGMAHGGMLRSSRWVHAQVHMHARVHAARTHARTHARWDAHCTGKRLDVVFVPLGRVGPRVFSSATSCEVGYLLPAMITKAVAAAATATMMMVVLVAVMVVMTAMGMVVIDDVDDVDD